MIHHMAKDCSPFSGREFKPTVFKQRYYSFLFIVFLFLHPIFCIEFIQNLSYIFFKGLSIKTLFCDDCSISGATHLVVEVFNPWNSLGRPLEWYFFPFTWIWGSLNSDTSLRRKVQGLATVFQQQRNESTSSC